MATARGRFAPTPSGPLHLGNARTALLAWLQIRQAGGEFVLRMEDIDRARSRREWAEAILQEMRWLGLDWEEGPDKGGESGPYVQSERQELYEAVLARLDGLGYLYPCYCSRADLAAAASAPHGLDAEGPAYPGTCRFLTDAERLAKTQSKRPSLRYALPPDHGVRFADGVWGERVFPPGAGGDFIVKRADGIISYQLAVVVDDAAMGITDVLRGSDLLDSTPRQIMLYAALDAKPPRFAHVPLLLGPDGQRLSKRHGSVSLEAMRKAGTPPEKVVGVLAYLSGLADKPEPVKAAELIGQLRLEELTTAPAVVGEDLLRSLA